MKAYFITAIIVCTGIVAHSHQLTYDIISYTAPKGWKAEQLNNAIVYAKSNGASWAQLAIYKSAASKGSIEKDSKSEWEYIVASQHTITGKTEQTKPATEGGWQVMSRSGIWQYNGTNVAAILTTYSNRQVCVSVILNTTALPYMEDQKRLLASLAFNTGNNASQSPAAQQSNTVTKTNSGFSFSPTTFDDGWISTAKQDWVEVTKPGIKILLHYPNQQADKYNSNKLDGDNAAWKILVAPRYNSIANLQERGIQDYQSVSFLTADATEKQSGKKVYVVLFKKHYDKGNGRYLEVVADSRAIFEKEFGNNYINRSSWEYNEQVKSWDKLANMQWRNKFLPDATSLTGTWTSNDYASLSYYYVNGGGFAGATATSIADRFTFYAGNKYESDHSGASGVVGNQKFARQVYKGNSYIKQWQLQLTNRFNGETENFACHFEAIKGGVILVLTDRLSTTKTLVRSK